MILHQSTAGGRPYVKSRHVLRTGFSTSACRPHLSRSERQNYGVIAWIRWQLPDRTSSSGFSRRWRRTATPTSVAAESSSKTLRSSTISRSYEAATALVNCFSAGAMPGCEIWPGQGRRQTRHTKSPMRPIKPAAMGNMLWRQKRPGRPLQLNPDIYPTVSFGFQALLAAGQNTQALEEVDQTLQLQPDASRSAGLAQSSAPASRA